MQLAPLETMETGQMDPSDRRQYPRQKVDALSLAVLGNENGGLILDLSEGGLSIQAIAPILPRTTSPLRFDLPDSVIRINSNVEIAWVNSSRVAGLRFTDLPEDAKQQIREWLQSHGKVSSIFESGLDSIPVYSDILPASGASPQTHSLQWFIAQSRNTAAETPEKTIRFVPDFITAPAIEVQELVWLEALPTVQPVEETEYSGTQTIRLIEEKISPYEATLREFPETVVNMHVPNELEEVRSAPEFAVRQSQAQPQVLNQSYDSTRFLQPTSAAMRRRMLYEQELQSRRVGLWLWEMGVSPADSVRIPNLSGQQDPLKTIRISALEPQQK